MDYFILQYIAQRMRELSIEDYSFQPVRVQPSNPLVPGSSTLTAYNEYYFLVAKTLAAGTTRIISDDNYFEEIQADYANYQFKGYEQFSGKIEITNSLNNPIDLEFIRVVPRLKVPEEKQQFITEQQILAAAEKIL